MSSLEEHLKKYTRSDAGLNARASLYDAITKAVAEVETSQMDVDQRTPRLVELAKAYSLVAHGGAAPTKS